MSEKKKERRETPSTVRKIYHCPVCKTNHTIKLPSNLSEDRKKYPFPYVFIHSSEDNKHDIVSMLYIDKHLQIRGSEAVKLENSNLVSEDVSKQVVNKLTNIIMDLEDENFKLKSLVQSQNIEDMIKEETKNLKEALLGPDKKKSKTEERGESKPLSFEVKDTQNQQNMTFQENLDSIPKPEHPKEKEINSKTSEDSSAVHSKTPQEVKAEKIAVYFASTIGPEKKKQKLAVNKTVPVKELKKTVGEIYGLITANFHLSAGGLTLDENRTLNFYNLSHNDEILIIPSSTAGIHSITSR
ncbi:MAG: ubiquitin-like domain-containing protein [Promethearchaeia archaeon]